MRKPRLFISHAWAYNNQYYSLVKLFNERPYFDFYNHSVPAHDPFGQMSNTALEQQLRYQIQGCNVVIALAGIYATYRNWIQKEIEIAKELGKPIIGVKPWGQERISTIIQENADEIVGWNIEPIIRAIRGYAY